MDLGFPKSRICILPLRGGLGGVNVSFSSFLCAKEKDRMGYGGVPHLPKGQKLRIWKEPLSKSHSTLSWYEKEYLLSIEKNLVFKRTSVHSDGIDVCSYTSSNSKWSILYNDSFRRLKIACFL
jgi:hypothetical protein